MEPTPTKKGVKSTIRHLVKSEGRVTLKDEDLIEAVKLKKLMDIGVTVNLDDLSLPVADVLRMLQDEMDEQQKEEMDKLEAEARRLK